MVSTPHSPTARPRVVVVAADVVGARMAGPGIRFVRIAEHLSDIADVTLAVGIAGSDADSVTGGAFRVATYATTDELVGIVSDHDVAFCQLIDENVVRAAARAGCRFVFDLYNALPAEAIGAESIGGADTREGKDAVFRDVLAYFRFCLTVGGYFVTSNERQRDFWIGYLLASGGLLPSRLDHRRASDLIGLVPFGMEDGEPAAAEHGIRGRFGIGADDLVLLWAGGIWDWFDAESPIRAVAELQSDRMRTHLVFYGTTHPNSTIGRPPAVERAEALASELGVLGERVHFIDGWVPADRRADYLLDADIAICAHKDSFETRYAFRTRILDHFWAGLPSIVTEGDWFADYIGAHDLGTVTDFGDVEGIVAAVRELSDPVRRAEVRAHVASIREDWRWSATTTDLRAAIIDWRERIPPAEPADFPEAPEESAPPEEEPPAEPVAIESAEAPLEEEPVRDASGPIATTMSAGKGLLGRLRERLAR